MALDRSDFSGRVVCVPAYECNQSRIQDGQPWACSGAPPPLTAILLYLACLWTRGPCNTVGP